MVTKAPTFKNTFLSVLTGVISKSKTKMPATMEMG